MPKQVVCTDHNTENIMLFCCFSVTIGLKGGCFSLPLASAILVFPPQVVEKEITLTCSRRMYKECEEKPKDGEAFVSRILKIEPEGVRFKKPVTILLSHSAYEDHDFTDYYELVVVNFKGAGREELKTDRISSIEGTGSKAFWEFGYMEAHVLPKPPSF